jgi:AraC-like DNA-binding protein
MQKHCTSVTLEELSGFFGYSERHMSRILKSYTGFSYQENLNHIKMRAAVNLLGDRTKSIDQIAGLLGFSTAYSFRKSFKNFFGITPGKYREQGLFK